MGKKVDEVPPLPPDSPIRNPDSIRTPDDYTIPELNDHYAKSIEHLTALDILWKGTRPLTTESRRTSKGRAAMLMNEILGKLFDVLLPPPKLTVEEEAALPPAQRHERSTREKLLSMFHVSLGDQDHGTNPEVFEVELLQRRRHRMMLEQDLAEKFEEFARRLGDDALDAGEKVIEPGMKAFRFAKSTALHNKAFEALLTPVLDKAQKMTASARKAQAEKRAEALLAKVAKKMKKGGENPTGGGTGGSGASSGGG